MFGYLILISMDVYDFLSPVYSFDLEDITNTQDSVWQNNQTLSGNIFSYFQLSPPCLQMWWNTVFRVWYIDKEIPLSKLQTD